MVVLGVVSVAVVEAMVFVVIVVLVDVVTRNVFIVVVPIIIIFISNRSNSLVFN